MIALEFFVLVWLQKTNRVFCNPIKPFSSMKLVDDHAVLQGQKVAHARELCLGLHDYIFSSSSDLIKGRDSLLFVLFIKNTFCLVANVELKNLSI